MSSGVILMSGGIDSAALIPFAFDEDGMEHVTFFQIPYNSRQNQPEGRAIYEMNKWTHRKYGPTVTKWRRYNISMWDDPKSFAKPAPTDITPEDNTIFVPGRNLVFLGMAVAYADLHLCDKVYFGAGMQDAVNQLFPDCTLGFLSSVNNAAQVGYQVTVEYPWVERSWGKADIVKYAFDAGMPFKYMYSCYEGTPWPKHCGVCAACRSRIEAFEEAGPPIVDTTQYMSTKELRQWYSKSQEAITSRPVTS